MSQQLPEWKLPDPPMASALEEAVVERARDFARRYRGRVAGLDPQSFVAACHECEKFLTPLLQLSNYADVLAASGRAQASSAVALGRVEELAVAVAEEAEFFEREIAEIDASQVKLLLADPQTAEYGNYVRKVRAAASVQPQGALKEALPRFEQVGSGGWERMARQLLDRIAVRAGAESTGLGAALPALYNADADYRRQRCAAISEALAVEADLRATVLTSLARARAVESQLRGATDWFCDQRIDAQLGSAEIAAMLTAVRGRGDIVHHYYGVKARLLGHPITDADRYAPLGQVDTRIEWPDAVDVVLGAFAWLGEDFVAAARRLLEQGAVDAAPGPGKQHGARTYSAPGGQAFVLVNFTGKLRDVLTLAHELAHGVQSRLTAHLGSLNAFPATTLAESVGLFAEVLAARSLLSQVSTPQDRLAVAGRLVEDRLIAIFRQSALHEFETRIHTAAWRGGALEAAEIAELWLTGQQRLYGEAVRLSPGYRHWWSYLDTFFFSPGRLPAYVFGQLAAHSLHARFCDDPVGFRRRYREMLAAGSSRTPAELFGVLGIRPDTEESWQSGLDALAAEVEELSQLPSASEHTSRVVRQDLHAGPLPIPRGGESL